MSNLCVHKNFVPGFSPHPVYLSVSIAVWVCHREDKPVEVFQEVLIVGTVLCQFSDEVSYYGW